MDAHNFIGVLTVSFLAWAHPVVSSDVSDPLRRDISILRETFEHPLRSEYETRGLSEEDAERATGEALDWLIACWRNQQRNTTEQSEEIMVVKLGESVIVTYATPCTHEFLELVGVSAN